MLFRSISIAIIIRLDLWIVISTNIIIFVIFKAGLMLSFSKLRLSYILGFLWSSSIAYVGGKPTPTSIDKRKSYKATVQVSLIGGMVIWIAYRSFLTADLSVTIKQLPFTDLNSLSNTNWRYERWLQF